MLLGEGHSLISLTCYGFIFNSFEEITKPKYMSYVFMKEHFFRFMSNFFYYNLFITNVKCLKCSSSVLLKTRISSKYTITNLPMNYLSTSLFNLMNVLGEFVKTNGIKSHSYNPAFILNVVFHSFPSLILI
jgi:hypothetical protein